jgi:CarD family transcriptional regulator
MDIFNNFSIGDKAVYPVHGVGVIEAIERKVVSGSEQTFYIMKILNNGMTIMIPRDNLKSVGLRQVISLKEVKKIYEILKRRDISKENHQTWNRKYREYTDKIKTGGIFEVAEVLRILFRKKSVKDLSFGEKKILDTAHNLLVKEISIAKNQSEDVVRKEMVSLLSS